MTAQELDLEALAGMVAEHDDTEVDEEAEAVHGEDGEDGEDVTDPEVAARNKARGAKIAAARRAKLDALFGDGKHYTVIKDFDLTGRTYPDTLPNGDPHPEAGKKVRLETALGNKITKGYSIKLDEGFTPTPPFAARLIFGKSVLLEAKNTYGAIELPEEVVKESGRTRRSSAEKEKAAKDKELARQALLEALADELWA